MTTLIQAPPLKNGPSTKNEGLPGDPGHTDMGQCMHCECTNPAVPGCAYGFRFCEYHLSFNRHHVPLPAGFTPTDGVKPYRKSRWNGGIRKAPLPKLSRQNRKIRDLLTTMPGQWANFPRAHTDPEAVVKQYRWLRHTIRMGWWENPRHRFEVKLTEDHQIIIKCEENKQCRKRDLAA